MHHFFVQLSGYDISICFSEILDSYVDFFSPEDLTSKYIPHLHFGGK